MKQSVPIYTLRRSLFAHFVTQKHKLEPRYCLQSANIDRNTHVYMLFPLHRYLQDVAMFRATSLFLCTTDASLIIHFVDCVLVIIGLISLNFIEILINIPHRGEQHPRTKLNLIGFDPRLAYFLAYCKRQSNLYLIIIIPLIRCLIIDYYS